MVEERPVAEVTNELMYELMQRIRSEISGLKNGQNELRQDAITLRNHMHLMHGDLNNLHTIMAQALVRLDRIENRLELRELQEAQARFEPHP